MIKTYLSDSKKNYFLFYYTIRSQSKLSKNMRIQENIYQPCNQTMGNFRNSEIVPVKIADDTIKEQKSGKVNTSTITLISLATVGSFVMLSRGFQKNAHKYLTKFKNYLSAKQEKSFLNDSDKKAKLYDFSIKRINSFIKKSESINNITSLKDILFMKMMYATKPTKKIHQSISDYFEKVSRKTVLDSYKKTAENFAKMNSTFDKLDKFIIEQSGNEIIEHEGKKITKKDLIQIAKSYRESANIVVDNFMSEKSLNSRYDYINEVTSTLYSKFWEASFKDFWSKNNKFKQKEMWQTFIAAEQIQGNKTKLAEWTALARNALTYNNTDRSEQLYNYIKKLDGIIPANNKSGLEIIERMRWFTEQPEALNSNKEEFFKQLQKLEDLKITAIDENLAKTQEEWKQAYIRIMKDLTDERTKGELQDMLSIYYKIAPYELDKSGASFAVKKAVDSFDKSVDLECVEFFDKIRDLRLGSAPTDILTIVLSFFALSWGLGYAKDKDTRTSIMLKSGVPLIGGIAATMYSTTKLVSGGKSLAFGILSSIILNQFGTIADDLRKNKNKGI